MKLIDTKGWKFDRKKGGRALYSLREQRGVTQDELSEASGVPKTLISRLENGGTEKPDISMLSRLYGAFGLSPSRAAQDYGVFVSHDLVQDPRAAEIRALLSQISPDEQGRLLDMLWSVSRAFMERSEQREKLTV